MDHLASLSEEQLVDQYAEALAQRDSAVDKLSALEDEHFRRNFGATALQWLVEQKFKKSEDSLVR